MVSLRPTATQALGRGAYLGAICGMIVAVLISLLAISGILATVSTPVWVAIATPAALGVVGGACIGLLLCRSEGEDIDDRGIHAAPGSGGFTPWQRIVDLRTERRSGRTRVAVYLYTGHVARLRAPYDGRWLGADPEFERKLFMLRNLWETHRSFTINNRFPTGN